MYKYMVEKYGGKLYCGNAFCNTLDDCFKFAHDGMCDKAVIIDYETGEKIIIKMEVKQWQYLLMVSNGQ